MNRKWLAGLTCSILLAGFTLLRAQSPAQSQSQSPAVGPELNIEQGDWVAAEPFDVFTSPVDVTTAPGLPLPDAAEGNVFFYSTADAGTDMAFAGPAEFTAALPFPGPDPQAVATAGVAVAGGMSFVGPDAQDNITFVGFQAGLGNQPVTGSPYAAHVTSEFVQTLSDGNKIERKTTTIEYRDGQGRTRREQTLPAIGSYSAGGQPPQVIFINDPVAGVSYVLDPVKKTARKMMRPNIQIFRGGPGGPGLDAGRGGPGGPGRGPGGNPPPPQPNAPTAGPQRGPRAQDANVTTETLGSQNIEGILVQGTRVVRTIPAGTVGNQQPIRVTSERWYSPKLQLNLLVKSTDPMRGENSTTLTDIRLDEPVASLFQVPADYTVQEPPTRRPGPVGHRGGTPPAPPAQ